MTEPPTPSAPSPPPDQAKRTERAESLVLPRPRASTLINVVLLALAVAAFAVLALRSEPGPGIEVERRAPAPGMDEIVAHVSGAVAAPGIVRVEPGERIVDAIERAGGPLPEADLDHINLALRVRDQDRLHVPAHGESHAVLIDLNGATQAELESLPGIGPARASGIIASRPLPSVEALIEQRLVPASVFEQIRLLVTVR